MGLKLLILAMLLPLLSSAHPGVGIVSDSKGNIYYTDLRQVWRISRGLRTVAVPDVHTHELYIDINDHLFGESERYDDRSGKFYHYLWRYRPTGQTDTVMGVREAYVQADFSLARDGNGAQYYTKQFLAQKDTAHIYKRTTAGVETVLATGNFKGVTWLHPQKDGKVLYIQSNVLHSVDTNGSIAVIKRGIANEQPSFSFSGESITIWGVWQDRQENKYVAVFSDQAVKRIDEQGAMTVVYRSRGNWAPLHGVFDPNNRLWILEGSDKNEVRVRMVPTDSFPAEAPIHNRLLLGSCFLFAIGIAFLLYRKLR